MVQLTPLALVVLASLSGLAAGFKQPCPAPYDVCGWMLANGDYGYEQAELQGATSDAGEDIAIAWDSVYTCGDDGYIEWSYHCGGGGTCDAGIAYETHAQCNANSPEYEGDGDEGDEGSDEGDDEGWDDDYTEDQTSDQRFHSS